MTVMELRDAIERLINTIPNTKDESIYFYEDGNLSTIESISIEYDIDGEGRYIVLSPYGRRRL